MLTAEEIATIVPIHQAVFDDADINVWAELRDPIAGAIGRRLDAAALLGRDRPASWPKSVLEGAIAAGNFTETGAPITAGGVFGDLEALLGLVEDDGFAPDNFVGAPSLRRRMRQSRNAQGDLLGDASTSVAWDLPVAYTPLVAPPHVAIAGDWQMLVVGIRQDINWTVSTDGVLTAADGKVVRTCSSRTQSRVVFRAAIAIANPATVENPDPDTRFPFAMLRDPEPGNGQAATAELDAEAAQDRQTRRPAGKR